MTKFCFRKKQVPKDVEVGDPVEVFLYKDSSDRLIRNHTGTEDHAG